MKLEDFYIKLILVSLTFSFFTWTGQLSKKTICGVRTLIPILAQNESGQSLNWWC